MPDFFQSRVPANLARGTNPRGSGLTWLFQVDASAVLHLVNCAPDTKAKAPGNRAGTPMIARFATVGGELGAADA